MWSNTRTKIRRFLRDPDGNIWEDDFLLNLWNNEQRAFGRNHKFDEIVTILRVPPFYQMTYLFDFEWASNAHAVGKTYQALIRNFQSPMVCSYMWEDQELGPGTGYQNDEGTRYTHPWEAYVISNPAVQPPNWFPFDFNQVIFLAYDNEPLEFITYKKMISQDVSWKQYTGEPQFFTMKETLEDEFYLYPRPDGSSIWDDIEDSGMVIHTDFATEASETGLIIDGTYSETNQNIGAAIDYLRTDDNVLLVYNRKYDDVAEDDDIEPIASYMRKYLMYGVLAQAYMANTDGNIKSLADYWNYRKQIGEDILNRYRYKRLADRDFRLTTGRAAPRQRRGPKLPSTYPPI